ncbi:MAG: type II secretion system GspH family protein [Patescibacteria group bacterium]|nr:type II secretion system GspH family protein [Patescibacteria group bacterium]
MNLYKNNNRGFTLIELLVVIAIIGILSSVVLASLSSARAKARDAKRLSDIRQIQTALEMYYSSNNSSYPNPGWGWRSECNGWGGFASDNVIPGLVPTYISSFPTDPSMDKTNSTSCYLYISNGTDYALLDHNIVDVGFSYLTQPTLFDPTRDSGSNPCVLDGAGFWSRKVSSPGGICW